MASDTFTNRYLSGVFAGGDSRRAPKVAQVSEALIYPGFIISVRNLKAYLYNNGDYAANGYYPSGIADLMDGHVLDTAYTITTDILEYFAIGQDTDVWVHCIAATPAPTYGEGYTIIASGTDGYGMVFSYTDGTSYTDSPLLKIGKVVEYRAGSTTETKLVKVNLI